MKTHYIWAIGLLMAASNSPANAAQSRDEQNHIIKTTITRFWSFVGADNKTLAKSIYAFPVSFVEITPTRAQTNFIFTEQDYEKESKRKGSQVPLKARLTNFKVRMVNQNLASVTYKMSIPQRKTLSRVFVAQTLPMQMLLKRDGSWKVMFSTLPYDM